MARFIHIFDIEPALKKESLLISRKNRMTKAKQMSQLKGL